MDNLSPVSLGQSPCLFLCGGRVPTVDGSTNSLLLPHQIYLLHLEAEKEISLIRPPCLLNNFSEIGRQEDEDKEDGEHRRVHWGSSLGPTAPSKILGSCAKAWHTLLLPQ